MLGFFDAVYAFLARQMGIRTDAANATGSLHAKVRHLNDTAVPAVTASVNANVNTRQRPRGPVNIVQSFQSSSSTYVTAYLVTGAIGRLVGLAMQSSSPGNMYARCTVDGHVVVTDRQGAGDTQVQYPSSEFWAGVAPHFATGSAGGRFTQFSIEFKSSLRIEIRNTSGVLSTVQWYVELE